MPLPIHRDAYGAIIAPAATVAAARSLIALAVASGKLDPEHVSYDRKRRGSSLNYAVYDLTNSGAAALVQRRETTGDKWGLHPRKSYWIIRRCGRGVTVAEVPKGTARKVAQGAAQPGAAITALRAKP